MRNSLQRSKRARDLDSPSPVLSRTKKAKTTSHGRSPSRQAADQHIYLAGVPPVPAPLTPPSNLNQLPWLRSGRQTTHPLIVEAATIQVQSLSEFKLAPPESLTSTEKAWSSQSTATEASPARITCAETFSYGATDSSVDRSSQAASGVAGNGNAEICPPRRYRYTGSQKVDDWYAEAFDSEGYDSEALALISTPPRASDHDAKKARPARLSTSSSITSSPGFSIVGDTASRNAHDVWRPEAWPDGVTFLEKQFNPRKWKFPPVSAGVRDGAGCGCQDRCNAYSCLNARYSRFCTQFNCAFIGQCGNALKASDSLAISRNVRTGMRGVTATAPIPAGEIIGQYFGRLELFGAPCRNGRANEGYRMHLKTKTTGGKYVGIDALECGGKLRMMNHSCNPAARFHEVQTGRELTVVAVTIRDVFPGEEVTVFYGNRLWFLCQCGWWGCQHRDIHHPPQAPSS